MLILVPGGGSNPFLAPALHLLVAVILDIDIAYILSGTRPKQFIAVLLGSIVATGVGAVLVALLIFRGQLWELVK